MNHSILTAGSVIHSWLKGQVLHQSREGWKVIDAGNAELKFMANIREGNREQGTGNRFRVDQNVETTYKGVLIGVRRPHRSSLLHYITHARGITRRECFQFLCAGLVINV
jgi:hypothetical protein